MIGTWKMTKLDTFAMRSYFYTYLALMPIMLLFAYMKSSDTLLYFTCSWFVALSATNIFAIEEKNNLGRLYGTLPIRLPDIVLGRYLFILLSYVAAVVLVLLFSTGIALYQGNTLSGSYTLLGIGVSFLAFALIVGVQLPIFFRLGYIKAKFWSMLPFLLVMVLAITPSLTNGLSGIGEFAEAHPLSLGLGSLLAGALLLAVSSRVAIVFYNKRR
jgi:ABC-type transport system involved in multi-copper enzyme maturation permease subunit